MQRLFLVGCPRSGTTLLQSLLAAHPDVASFPESDFFNHLFPHSEPKRRRLGIISRRAKPKFTQFMQESGHSGHCPSRLILFPRQLTAHFAATLDQLTIQQNKTTWLEKTPTHLYHLDYIAQRIAQSKFIHIIREGKDAVASLYDVRKKYPDQWANEPASVELSINRWLKDVAISLQYAHSPRHLLVSYEALVTHTQATLAQICQFVGIDFIPTMQSGYTAAAQQVSLAREPWKAAVGVPIHNANATKFYELFDQQQQQHILQRTLAIDLSALSQTHRQR